VLEAFMINKILIPRMQTEVRVRDEELVERCIAR